MKLSILIPSLIDRAEKLNALKLELNKQAWDLGLIQKEQYEIKTYVDNKDVTIGKKRNELLQSAKGEYVCFIDDDDIPSSNYIKKIFEGIESGLDCCSLVGVITWDGINPELFEHSIKYKEYKTNEGQGIKYERYPNHLNVIKTEIAKQFIFPETNFGEDTDWATQVYKSGLIKTEYEIQDVLYHYDFKTKKI